MDTLKQIYLVIAAIIVAFAVLVILAIGILTVLLYYSGGFAL